MMFAQKDGNFNPQCPGSFGNKLRYMCFSTPPNAILKHSERVNRNLGKMADYPKYQIDFL